MARQWRLRHKLLLGLGLVVGSVGLLVAGTMMGLNSYVSTMNTADSKLKELTELDKFKAELNALKQSAPPASTGPTVADYPSPQQESFNFKNRLEAIEHSFGQYKDIFQDTVTRKRDPDPYTDARLIEDIEGAFARLKKAAYLARQPQVGLETRSLLDDKGVKDALKEIDRMVEELHSQIVKDMYDRIHQARTHYRHSMWTVGAATGLALLLVVTLTYLFGGWVFNPIRQLQAGVQRVFRGDFNTPIELRSGDELEELATAFNDTAHKLHDIYRDLERQVNERSRQLVRSERMVSVGFLAAGVAHEINNPLASIAFCSEALQSRLEDYVRRNPQETEVVAKYLRMIQQEAFRCKEITSKLLEFSRVGERRREPTDLSDLVQGVLEIAQHLQNCRGKRIVFQPMARVMAGVNAQDIKSVVLNLVVNALDSMDEGGILTITLQQRGPSAELLFVDTGCGMTPDTLQNIFEPFFTRSRTGKGTGLGLFICHQIIDQHGGEILAASPGANQGSTFTVRVPIQPAEGGQRSPAGELPEVPATLALHEARPARPQAA